MNDYDSWTQHALVAEVKARVKAGEIDRSDLDYRRPDNMPMDDLRSALFWNEYVPPPCCCPIHARQRDFAAGKLDTPAARYYLEFLEQHFDLGGHLSRYQHLMRIRENICREAVWARLAEPGSPERAIHRSNLRELREMELRWRWWEQPDA